MSENPTFGYLASLVPTLKTRSILHVAPAGKLVEGKIAVTHRNPYPVKIRIGVSTGSLTSFTPESYILYDHIVGEGESYESDFIYYANNQSLVVWTDTENVNFIIHGQINVDPTPSGFVASTKILQANKKQILYTVPGQEEALVSIFAANQGASQARFRVSISSAGSGLNTTQAEYLEYNTDLSPRSSYQRTNIKVSGGQSVVISSDNTDVSFSAYAKFNYNVVSTDFSIGGDLSVGDSVTVVNDLDVGGQSSFTQSATFDADVTIEGNLTLSGLLRGYTSGGSLAYTISNATGGFSTIGSISAGGSIQTSNNLTVGTNKFSVSGSTGNISTTGTLTASGGIASNLNLLNNKVTNLAEPSAPSDAATRRYVDGKITALSIALG